jgi:hypothetical protein
MGATVFFLLLRRLAVAEVLVITDLERTAVVVLLRGHLVQPKEWEQALMGATGVLP